jgi:hypothetical protein
MLLGDGCDIPVIDQGGEIEILFVPLERVG